MGGDVQVPGDVSLDAVTIALHNADLTYYPGSSPHSHPAVEQPFDLDNSDLFAASTGYDGVFFAASLAQDEKAREEDCFRM